MNIIFSFFPLCRGRKEKRGYPLDHEYIPGQIHGTGSNTDIGEIKRQDTICFVFFVKTISYLYFCNPEWTMSLYKLLFRQKCYKFCATSDTVPEPRFYLTARVSFISYFVRIEISRINRRRIVCSEEKKLLG